MKGVKDGLREKLCVHCGKDTKRVYNELTSKYHCVYCSESIEEMG